jgi:xanthine dehydrogenase YagT iron-sulfur-binding subunit
MIARSLDVGDPAPDFQWVGTDGVEATRRTLRGQVTLLAFLSDAWDPAASHWLSSLNRLLNEMPECAGLVSAPEEGFWWGIRQDAGDDIRFPILPVEQGDRRLRDLFGVQGRQAVFVIDAEGIIAWAHIAEAGVRPSEREILTALSGARAKSGVSRREFLVAAIAASLLLAGAPRLSSATTQAPVGPDKSRTISLQVNGKSMPVEVEPRVTLLDALRERMNLTGTKKGCDHGQCGACTVHLDGRRVNSCLVLAMQAEGSHITTVEGLAHGDKLAPIQEAFIKHDGFQCGYCTSGQLMSAAACIQEGHVHSDAEIGEWMSGNICRCGAYVGIREAIKEAARGSK